MPKEKEVEKEEEEEEEQEEKLFSDKGDKRHLEKPYAHWQKPYHSNVPLNKKTLCRLQLDKCCNIFATSYMNLQVSGSGKFFLFPCFTA
jgi:hypothetical protein